MQVTWKAPYPPGTLMSCSGLYQLQHPAARPQLRSTHRSRLLSPATAVGPDGSDLPQLGAAAEQMAASHGQPMRTGGLRGPWRKLSRALHLPYAPKDTAASRTAPSQQCPNSQGADLNAVAAAQPPQQEVMEPSAIWQTAWDEFERAACTPLSSLQGPRKRRRQVQPHQPVPTPPVSRPSTQRQGQLLRSPQLMLQGLESGARCRLFALSLSALELQVEALISSENGGRSLHSWTRDQWAQASRRVLQDASQAAASAWLGSPLALLQPSSQPEPDLSLASQAHAPADGPLSSHQSGSADGKAAPGFGSSTGTTNQQFLAGASHGSTGRKAKPRTGPSLPVWEPLRQLFPHLAHHRSSGPREGAPQVSPQAFSAARPHQSAWLPAQESPCSPGSRSERVTNGLDAAMPSFASDGQSVADRDLPPHTPSEASAMSEVASPGASASVASAVDPSAMPEAAANSSLALLQAPGADAYAGSRSFAEPAPSEASDAASTAASAGLWEFAEERQGLYGHLLQHLCCPVQPPDRAADSSARRLPSDLTSQPANSRSFRPHRHVQASPQDGSRRECQGQVRQQQQSPAQSRRDWSLLASAPLILEDMAMIVAEAVAAAYLNALRDGQLREAGHQLGRSTAMTHPGLASTRGLERFRNQATLAQAVRKGLHSVVAMYEDRHTLWGLGPGGCVLSRSIRCRRIQELEALKGWQQLLSLGLEAVDFAMPLLRRAGQRMGEALSWLLVRFLGRALGLLFRGIRQSLVPNWGSGTRNAPQTRMA
ncbi:hypothetical protein WJX74_010069 [Apatococcus lobatus]|uniref:Uncharacterized protein n=1 Tax=Apatococcus lobatus TaxID=904363 RepID=A0AAW1R2W8_9CHLO